MAGGHHWTCHRDRFVSNIESHPRRNRNPPHSGKVRRRNRNQEAADGTSGQPYILLMTLRRRRQEAAEGRERMAADPERVLRAGSEVRTADTHMLGLYGVLGNYDFVAIIESSDNAGIARFSLDMGVAAGVHITTLPAIPIARFEAPNRDEEFDFEAQLSSPSEGDTVDTGL